jgi:AcrR family transcriptional regulator
MTNIIDRRVQKTRQILQKAIIELIVEKGFESIKVQDILDKANVGRSTFYAHYQDKGELLHSCFDELHKLLEQHAINLSEYSRNSPDLETITDFTFKLFKFAERNSQLFKALLGQQDLSEFMNSFLFDYLNDPLKRRMARDKNSFIPAEIITHYFINAFFGVLKWWVSNNMPCTAEEIDGYFKQLAMPTIKSIILANN